MKTKEAFLYIFFVFICVNLSAQVDTLIYLEEDFESTENWQEWQSLPESEITYWDRHDGGSNLNPPSAYEGDYNAYFHRAESSPVTRTLVSKPINMAGAKKPQLSFYHTQAPSLLGQDDLYLMFKVGEGGDWTTITSFLNPIEDWTYYYLNINEYGEEFLADSFYIGFQGGGPRFASRLRNCTTPLG